MGVSRNPVEPRRHSITGPRRKAELSDLRIHPAGVCQSAFRIEIDMRLQVDLGEQHQIRRSEHIRVLERLVIALGDREDDHLEGFAEVECCGTHQVADVLDKRHAPRGEGKLVERVPDHMGIEMTATTGVDLHRRHAARPDAIRIVGGLLIAFDDDNLEPAFELLDGFDEERGLAGAGARHQIEGEHPALGEPRSIYCGIVIVTGKNVALDLDEPLLSEARNAQSRGSGAVVVMMPVEGADRVVMMRMRVIVLKAIGRRVVTAANCAHGLVPLKECL